MKRRFSQNGHLRKTTTIAGIAVLALGFYFLGLLSLINERQACEASGRSFEAAYSILGSATSVFLGGIFLVAGSMYWNRSF